HGRARAPAGNSPSLTTYTKDGSSNRSSTTPGAVSCGVGTTSPEPSDKSRNARAQLVVPRSMPTVCRLMLRQFHFGGRDDTRIQCFRDPRHPDFGGNPSVMFQRALERRLFTHVSGQPGALCLEYKGDADLPALLFLFPPS